MKVCPKCEMSHEDERSKCGCGYDFDEDVIRKVTKWARFFHYHRLNAKYSALYIIGLLLDVLAVISLLYIILGVAGGLFNHSFMMVIVAIISGIASYIIFKAISESIILFIGIEENTSKTNDILGKILESLRESQITKL